MQESCITLGRKKSGCILEIGITVVEDEAVKHAVDQVANGPGINQGSTNDKTLVISLLNNSLQIKCSENHGEKTKQRESHLTQVSTELPPIGHALIFNKMKPEPASHHTNLFANVKM